MLSNNFDTKLKGTKNEHAVSTKKTLQAPFNPLFKRTSIALIIITPPSHLSYPDLDHIHFISEEN